MALMFRIELNKVERLLRGEAALAEQKAKVTKAFSAGLEKGSGNVIVAAESVSLLDEHELAEMKEWFVSRGFRIRLLCHIRHLPQWINSMIAQMVVGGQRMTIGDAVKQLAGGGGGIVQTRVERLQRVFPDAEFCSHEEAVAYPNGPPGFFLDRLGISTAGIKFVRANEGASDVAVRAISLANVRFGKIRDGAANADFVDVSRAIRVVGGVKFALRGEEVAALLPAIEREEAWLADTFGPKFRSAGTSFSPVRRIWTDDERSQVLNAALGLPDSVRAWLSASLRD